MVSISSWRLRAWGSFLPWKCNFDERRANTFRFTISEPASRLIQTSWNAVAMLRLLVATAAFRACYKHLNAKEASAMRAAVWRIPTVSQALTSSRRASGALLRSLRRVALMGGLWTRRPSQGPFFQWWISVVSFDSTIASL